MKPSPRVQFPLRLLLMSFVPVALGAMLIRVSLEQQPVAWQPYTDARKNELVAGGATVLVFCQPNYHPGGQLASYTFDDCDVRRSFHAGRFQAMMLQYDDWEGDEIRAVLKKYGHRKGPIVLLFSPNQKVLDLDPYSADDLLSHLPHLTPQAASQKRLTVLLLASLAYCGYAYWRWFRLSYGTRFA